MKASLMRFNGERLGLIVEGPYGKQIVDVIQSLDKISVATGQSNQERFRGVGTWTSILEKWPQLRPALVELMDRAKTSSKSDLVMFPLETVHLSQASASQISIAALQISEFSDVAIDPTGREIMARQFSETHGRSI